MWRALQLVARSSIESSHPLPYTYAGIDSRQSKAIGTLSEFVGCSSVAIEGAVDKEAAGQIGKAIISSPAGRAASTVRFFSSTRPTDGTEYSNVT